MASLIWSRFIEVAGGLEPRMPVPVLDIKPKAKDLVSRTLLVARDVPPSTGIATFVIRRDSFYAICGTMYQDAAVQVNITDRQPVRLGVPQQRDVEQTWGTTVAIKVKSDSLFTCLPVESLDCGRLGAFNLKTMNFHFTDAKYNGYMAGLGVETAPNAHVGIHASFTPEPNQSYHITPSKVYSLINMACAINDAWPKDLAR
ncbi:hypothetical protein E4U53_007960 [Claviceps sorghi]|nr:hypothetical protein E4U53_007960 [Claviceps sorghi]